MTAVITPPADLAPRVASYDPSEFPVPTGREEAWRFTPLERIADFMEVQGDAGHVTSETNAYVSNMPVAEAHDGWVPTDRPSAIARAHANNAVVVSIPADAVLDSPVVVRLQASARTAYGHVVVRAGHHSRATVVIEHDLAADVAGALVVLVGDGADLTVTSLMDGSDSSRQLWHWPARIGRDARFVGAQAALAGGVVRMLPSVEYSGSGGHAELLGAFLVTGRRDIEHRIFVDHNQPHCSSNVAYKGTLSGAGAQSVWVGDILVRREGIGTDTYEMNRNLILDEGAVAHAVPNLELETADIVRAGHASATGRFDDEQLFYLMARGIPEPLARQLVVRGFFADVVARIADPEWADQLMLRIEARLGMQADEATA